MKLTSVTASVFSGVAFCAALIHPTPASGFDFAVRDQLVPADVLDAPFAPSPGVLAALGAQLPRLCAESPPTHAEPLVAAVARASGVPAERVLVSSGSSSLLFWTSWRRAVPPRKSTSCVFSSPSVSMRSVPSATWNSKPWERFIAA